MRNRASIVFALFLTWLAATPLLARNDCLALLTAQVVKSLGDQATAVFRLASSDGPVSEGLAAALRSRQDGAVRVRQILDYFGEATSADIFGLLNQVKAVPGLSDLVVNLGKQTNDAIGAAATLRYVTTQMDPAQLARFEFPVPGAIADAVDKSGNLFEFKALNLEEYPEFLVKQEFEDTRSQVELFEAYVQGTGKSVTLAFQNAIPASHKALFDSYFGEMLSRGTVKFVDGF
jgi:hypothetical protein